jgi:hypothetical protein
LLAGSWFGLDATGCEDRRGPLPVVALELDDAILGGAACGKLLLQGLEDVREVGPAAEPIDDRHGLAVAAGFGKDADFRAGLGIEFAQDVVEGIGWVGRRDTS